MGDVYKRQLHGLAGAVRGTGASIPPMVVLLVSLCLFLSLIHI